LSSSRRAQSPKLKTNRSSVTQQQQPPSLNAKDITQFLAQSQETTSKLNRVKIAGSPERRNSNENLRIVESLGGSTHDSASSAALTNVTRLSENDQQFKSSSFEFHINENNDNLPLAASNRRSSPSNSASTNRTDRSSTPPATATGKALPPVIKRTIENVPASADPMPFLNSTASTLHTRSRKDFIQRRTLITLPPIKPFEMMNQLAVESPHKALHNSNVVNSSGGPMMGAGATMGTAGNSLHDQKPTSN
jgi:hypothetical protein